MTRDEDDESIRLALAEVPPPALDGELAARVGRLARAELAPASGGIERNTWRLTLSGALVPTLLVSAAVIRTADNVKLGQQVFGVSHPRPGRHQRRTPRHDAPAAGTNPGERRGGAPGKAGRPID